jgi:antitoxin (DNA-binding transcriptional repressor) of toxin-antitoxin stability system
VGAASCLAPAPQNPDFFLPQFVQHVGAEHTPLSNRINSCYQATEELIALSSTVMATLRITESELARDLHGVLEKVRQGVEVIVEDGHRPVAVIKTPQGSGRTISECIELAKEHEDKLGYPPTLDPDFAADVQEIIRDRKPWHPPVWD